MKQCVHSPECFLEGISTTEIRVWSGLKEITVCHCPPLFFCVGWFSPVLHKFLLSRSMCGRSKPSTGGITVWSGGCMPGTEAVHFTCFLESIPHQHVLCVPCSWSGQQFFDVLLQWQDGETAYIITFSFSFFISIDLTLSLRRIV